MPLAAAILLISIFWTASLTRCTASQSAPESAPPTATSPEQQGQQPTETAKPKANPSSPAAAKPRREAAAKKPVHKKKVIASGCKPAPAPADPSSPTATAQPQTPAPDPKNCPPEKIIVRQGGTAEPSIQLAGRPGGDGAAQKRDAANQLLGSTEANLKKIGALQLSSIQLESVAQIRQFVDQSRAALAAGDMERGHTLAWKAELLSEDLVKPQK